jgi:hypothetical protein
MELFDGKIGAPYDDDILKQKREVAQKRCEQKIPPGYKDYKSTNPKNSFGDILIWFQLLDKASQDKKPIIFITGDSKEDWWSTFEGKTIGPRPKLIQEFLAKTGQQYYQYQQLKFMELAKDHFGLSVRDASMAEVEEVSKKADDSVKREAFRAATPYTLKDVAVWGSHPTTVGLYNVDWVTPKLPEWATTKLPDWATAKLPDWATATTIPKDHLNIGDLINNLGLANEELENIMQKKIETDLLFRDHIRRTNLIRDALNNLNETRDKNEKTKKYKK